MIRYIIGVFWAGCTKFIFRGSIMKRYSLLRGKSLIFLLLTIFLSSFVFAGKTGPGIIHLQQMKKTEPGKISRLSRQTADEKGLEVSIRFKNPLKAEKRSDLSSEGVIFHKNDQGGLISVSNRIFRAYVNWDALKQLVNDPDVEWIESLYGPPPAAPLNIANPEVGANDLWNVTDTNGDDLSGKGMLIGDLDWGCDIFHPDFYRADGPVYDWIDVNENGEFDAGIDVVDLDDNDIATTPSELLSFFDGYLEEQHSGVVENDDGIFQSDLDWLYNDSNNDGERDFGTAEGYSESDPTYGELFFLVIDDNDNQKLDPGEQLQSLDTCKIKYYRTNNGDTLERGVDLIDLLDYSSGERGVHGTGVCGILCAQERGFGRKYVGIAPDADIAHATIWSSYDYVTIMNWMKSIGVDVMLHEYSGIVGYHFDGSSNTEVAITDYARNYNIPSAIPAGNLGRSDKNAICEVPASGSLQTGFDAPSDRNISTIWMSFVWTTTDNRLGVTITDPNSNVADLGKTGGTNTDIPNVTISDATSVSPRGTVLRDLSYSSTSGYLPKGDWIITFTNDNDATETVRMRVQDNQSSWYPNGAEFTTHQTRTGNGTFPVWADEGIGVASYATRGTYSDDPSKEGGAGAPPGELSGFSGRGPRVDGVHSIDIAAPGNYDIRTAWSPGSGFPYGSYFYMSGTSAAGPFVAASCALVKQANPALTGQGVRNLIRGTAKTDSYTGTDPDPDSWGAGKLNVYNAVDGDGVTSTVEDLVPSLNIAGSLYPNPGDGNGDGILDRLQSNAASVSNVIDGRYVTLETSATLRLFNVASLDNPGFTPYDSSDWPYGFTEYSVEPIPEGERIAVDVRFEESLNSAYQKVFKHGSMIRNAGTWVYPFYTDEETGNEWISSSYLRMHLKDGYVRGDDDLTTNAVISDPFAPGYVNFHVAVVDELKASAAQWYDPVLVQWDTSSEVDCDGFHVYDALEIFGSYIPGERLNSTIISATGSESGGAHYEFWHDSPLENQEERYYFIEDNGGGGIRTLHGPEQAVIDPSTRVERWSLY